MPYPRFLAPVAAFAIALCAIAGPAFAQIAPGQSAPSTGEGPAEGKPIVPPGLEDVGVTEHLDGQIPMDAMFRDSTGKPVRFGDLFDGKRPVVLTLAYHTCPTVCSLVLSQTVDSLKKIEWSIGDQYDAITLSFDPHETLERTAAKRTQLLAQYGRPGADKGWAFLLGDDVNIHKVTDAVGFKYHYVASQQQFAHPTVIMILKPNGEVARYLYGLEYSPNDLRLGLLEASNGKSISTVDKVLLYCYHYDPNSGRYVLLATRVMQLGGVCTFVALAGFMIIMYLRDRARRHGPPPPPAPPADEEKTASAPAAH